MKLLNIARALERWNSAFKCRTYKLRILLISVSKYYKQVDDGVAMGSPMGPATANFFCVALEVDGLEIFLMISNQCFKNVKLMTYVQHCFLLLIMFITLRSILHLSI